MRIVPLSVALLAGLALAAASASALPAPVEVPQPWFSVSAGTECLGGDDDLACLEVTCTLDLPPSRCGNGLVSVGAGL